MQSEKTVTIQYVSDDFGETSRFGEEHFYELSDRLFHMALDDYRSLKTQIADIYRGDESTELLLACHAVLIAAGRQRRQEQIEVMLKKGDLKDILKEHSDEPREEDDED